MIDYAKASAISREKGYFTKDKLDECMDGFRDVLDALTEVREGKSSIMRMCRDRGWNLMQVRRAMYAIGARFEEERKGLGYGDKLELLSPLEKLYRDIFNCDDKTTEVYDVMPPDAYETIAHIFENRERVGLTEREVSVLNNYYFEEKTLEEVGKLYGVTRERIRQILAKALRKLRHPQRRNLLENGMAYLDYVEMEYQTRKEEEKDRLIAEKLARDAELEALRNELEPPEDTAENMHIRELGLSVRSYNCLLRAGYETVGDLKNTNELRLMKCRNLGKKSLAEVVNRIRDYYPEWGLEQE